MGVRVFTRSGAVESLFAGPSWWVAGLLLALALLLQLELVHFFTFRGAEPSLVLVFVVWYALHADWRRAALFGLAAGLCEDALSAQTGGAWTISTVLTATLAGLSARWFFADSIIVAGIVVFAATLVRRMIFWAVMALQGYPPGYAGLHFHQALWTSVLNMAVMAAAMLIVRRFGQPEL